MASFQDSLVKKKRRKKRKTPYKNKRCLIHIVEKNARNMTASTNVSWKLYLTFVVGNQVLLRKSVG